MSHTDAALTEMLFVKHFTWFMSCLSGSPSFWSQSLVARSKTTSEFCPSILLSKAFLAHPHILFSFMLALFVDTEACRNPKVLYVCFIHTLKTRGLDTLFTCLD